MPELSEELLGRLREAGAEELRGLVRDLGEALDLPAAQAVLRNPHAGEEIVRLLATERRLLTSYEMRRDLALHAATPQPIALALVAGLYWRDLVAAGLDVRIRPVVRRFADQRLIERLPALAVGEKVGIARGASPHVLQVLRHDPTPRLAVIRNPRAPLALVLQQLPMLKKPDLRAVAADPRLALPLRRKAELLA